MKCKYTKNKAHFSDYLGAPQLRLFSLHHPLSAVSFVPGLSQGLQKDAAPIGARIEGQRPPIGLCVYFLVFGIFEVFHFFSIKV